MPATLQYQVRCIHCDQTWQPTNGSPLWWKAMKRAQEGYLDALPASSQECGCEPAVKTPDARYRVLGYNDMCENFDLPFYSLVAAAKQYLDLAREGMCTVFFVDNLSPDGKSPVEMRLNALAM